MKMSWLFVFALVLRAAAQTAELPKQDDQDTSFDPEPPLLIQNGINEEVYAAQPAPSADVAQLEKKLESARRNAISAQRLVKAGVLAQVEAEARALRVVRLTAELQNARLTQATNQLSVLQQQQAAPEEVAEAREAVTRCADASHQANAAKDKAELDAAKLNLERQQKLLSLGSARKSDVARAEAKVNELQAKTSGRN